MSSRAANAHPLGCRPGRAGERGFSLIEVLVAMVVLGVAVLAFAGLQVRALDTTGSAHMRAQAMAVATELAERMRINKGALATYRTPGLYDGASVPVGNPADWPAGQTCISDTPIVNNGCNGIQMATFDVNEIEFIANSVLPAGRVRLGACPTGGGTDCIFVSWAGVDPATCVDNTTPNCIMLQAVVL